VRGTTNWRTQDGEVPVDSTRDFQTIDQMNNRLVDGINNVNQKQQQMHYKQYINIKFFRCLNFF
jgi:hypothetical protein